MIKRIAEFEPYIKDMYYITDDGEVYSDNYGKMKSRLTVNGYKIINLMKTDGTKKTFKVHRLVLKAFNPLEDYSNLEVNHIDGNKENNKLNNLEWCTSSYNQKHACETGLQKPRQGSESNFAKLTEKDVLKIFELRKQGLKQKEIAKIINTTPSNVSAILRRKSWKSLKFNDYPEKE